MEIMQKSVHQLEVFGAEAKAIVKTFLKSKGIEYVIQWGGYYDFAFRCSDEQWEEIKAAVKDGLPANV